MSNIPIPKFMILSHLLQIPIFISFSLSIRQMCGIETSFPFMNKPIEPSFLYVEQLQSGGLSWWIDLTATDPSLIFPLLIGAVNLTNFMVNPTF